MAEVGQDVVLITGGAAGLGAALARRFIQEGARVVVLDRSAEQLDLIRQELGTDEAAFVLGDVTDLDANEHAVAVAVEKFGRLDVFIGNAALWDFSVSLLDLPRDRVSEAFDEVFSVNVKGYLLGARAAAPELVKSRGSIIFTLSNAALYPSGGGPLYVASKHAGVGLTKQLAYELAPHVRVNAVAPSGMATGLSGPRALGQQKDTMRDKWDDEGFASRVPLGFVPKVEDYIGGYLFLASRSEAATVTGVVLPSELGWGVRGIRSVAGNPTV